MISDFLCQLSFKLVISLYISKQLKIRYLEYLNDFFFQFSFSVFHVVQLKILNKQTASYILSVIITINVAY